VAGRWILLTVVLALVSSPLAAACGDDDDVVTQSTTSPPPVPPTLAEGCDETFPIEGSVRNAEFADSLVTVCYSEDLSRLSVKNSSEGTVLRTDYIRERPVRSWEYVPSIANTPADQAARRAVGAGCSFGQEGYCIVVPGDSMEATGTPPASVTVSVEPKATVEANFARAGVEYLVNQLQTPAGRVTSRIAGCANGASSTLGNISSDNWENAMLDAVTHASTCKALYRDIFGQPEQEVAATKEILGIAKSSGRGVWLDYLKYTVTRVIH
jgi:hypothetical protein